MKITDKAELTVEERAALEKKENRNQVIALAVGIGTTVAGILLDRKLRKDLNAELDRLKERDAAKEAEEN